MPAAFESCVRRGGKVRTKTLSGDRFMRICFIGGKSFAGEVKTKKAQPKNKFSKGLSHA